MQILNDFMRENMLSNMNAPDVSEYVQNKEVNPGTGINLLA